MPDPLSVPWIRSVPLCRSTDTVAMSLDLLYQTHTSVVVLMTNQGHAFATIHLKDLLAGLASRILRIEQPLESVAFVCPLYLFLLPEQSPADAWWNLWKRLGTLDPQNLDLDYGLMNLRGEFLGLLDYPEFLRALWEYCPDRFDHRFDHRFDPHTNYPIGVSSISGLLPSPPSPVQAPPLDQETIGAGLPQEKDPDREDSPPFMSLTFIQVLLNTWQPQFQALLEYCQALGRSNTYKDRLLDRLSHDLKAPLTSILGLSTLLKENIIANEGQTHRYSYYGALIYQNSRYLMSLLVRLMELARLETQQKPLHLQKLYLRPLLEQCWLQAQEELGLRDPPDTVVPFPPPPAVDSQLIFWGDADCSHTLLTLFLTYGLEPVLEGNRVQVTTTVLGGAQSQTQPPCWQILTLQWQGDSTDQKWETGDIDPEDDLDWWMAQRFAHGQGAEIHRFGCHLTLFLPKNLPIASEGLDILDIQGLEGHLDFNFVVVGLENSRYLWGNSPFVPWVENLRAAGIFTLFATSEDRLTYMVQHFRPGLVLLERGWRSAWEALALDLTLNPIKPQPQILSIHLANSGESVPDLPIVPPLRPVPECFTLPQGFQQLWDFLWTQVMAGNPQGPDRIPPTFLWLGSSPPDAEFVDLFPGCQILEAEGVDQAELLVQIWDLQAIVINPKAEAEWSELLTTIRSSEVLSALRLVTWQDLKRF